jgi:tetratricopeptide (TPR) repeat protein
MAAWEQSIALDPGFATAHRNLGLAFAQVENDVQKAIASLDRAVGCDPADPRLLFERDVLYETGRVPALKRLEALLAHQPVVVRHNDACSREILLLTRLGRYDEAITALRTHHFRKWEGVGNIHTTYVDAHLLRGWQRLEAGQARAALSDFEAALEYPENLEVARPVHGGRAGQCWYFSGLAFEAAGEMERARLQFEKSAAVTAGGVGSVLRYYQGLACKKRGRNDAARRLFDGLIAFAEKRLAALSKGEAVDYFAKFGRRRPLNERQAHAHYLSGLGHRGHARRDRARAAFEKALALNPDHLWARAELARLDPGK